jgi:hypothetical protein
MDDWITLALPRGEETWEYPISHGDRQYHPFRADHTDPASDWLVTVPRHVAVHLLHRGGFFLPATATIIRSEGTCRMRHPDGNSCGWGGIAFEPDADGVVTVPLEAVPDLLPHGFKPAPPKPEPAPEEPKHAPGGEQVAEAPRKRQGAPPQTSDTAARPFAKDPEGTPHPDVPPGAAPGPAAAPAKPE